MHVYALLAQMRRTLLLLYHIFVFQSITDYKKDPGDLEQHLSFKTKRHGSLCYWLYGIPPSSNADLLSYHKCFLKTKLHMGLGFSSVFRLGAQNSHFYAVGSHCASVWSTLKITQVAVPLFYVFHHTQSMKFSKSSTSLMLFCCCQCCSLTFGNRFTCFCFYLPVELAELNTKLQGVHYRLYAAPYCRYNYNAVNALLDCLIG